MSPPAPTSASTSVTSNPIPPNATDLSPHDSPCENFDPTQIAETISRLYRFSPPEATDSWINAFPYSTSNAPSVTAYYWLRDVLSPYKPQFSLMWTYAIGMNDAQEYEPIPRRYLKTTVCDHTYVTDLIRERHIVWPLLNYSEILGSRYLGPGTWLFNSPDDFVKAYVKDETTGLFSFHLFTDMQAFLPDSPYQQPTFEQLISPTTPKKDFEAVSWQASRHYYKLRKAFGLD